MASLLRWLGAAGLALTLAACATASTENETAAPAAPKRYILGATTFEFPDGAVLQTWPDMSGIAPTGDRQMHFARLAVQIPAEELVPELAGFREPIQIDILLPALLPDADALIRSSFTDWAERENAPSNSTYKYIITSQRGATGTRIAYLRLQQPKLGLDSLAPFQPQAGAPIYLVGLDDTHVTTLIECGPLPAGYRGPDHCSLRRPLAEDYGYRVLFPLDLLIHWQKFDAAARSYVAAAAN